MAQYTKATNFAAKDALLPSDPDKIIKGTEFDDEFNAIQTAVNSKSNAISPNFNRGSTSTNSYSRYTDNTNSYNSFC